MVRLSSYDHGGVHPDMVDLPSKAMMQEEYWGKIKSKGISKAYHSWRGEEVRYVDDLLGWLNGASENFVDGRIEEWYKTKTDQLGWLRRIVEGSESGERKKTVQPICVAGCTWIVVFSR